LLRAALHAAGFHAGLVISAALALVITGLSAGIADG
jgi:hypothetical protein